MGDKSAREDVLKDFMMGRLDIGNQLSFLCWA